MSLKDAVSIFEVGPRDGLQNEKKLLPLADKVWLIEGLNRAGLAHIEAGSFVRADRVPQMAESDLLPGYFDAEALNRQWYLVPNRKGLSRAIERGVKNIAVFTAVTDGFNLNNIGMKVSDSLLVIADVVTEAKAAGLKVRAYVSTAWGCPFEGRVEAAQALPVLRKILSLPIDQLSIGDTIGVANPHSVELLLRPLLKEQAPERLAVHFHDTRGTALANALRSFEMGIRTFDSSIGGLGGCPFAPGASGNLATEDLVYLFKEMGIETKINYPALCQLSLELAERMGKALPSRALKAFQSNCAVKNPWDT